MNISHQRIDLKVIRLDQTSPWPALQIDRSRLSRFVYTILHKRTLKLTRVIPGMRFLPPPPILSSFPFSFHSPLSLSRTIPSTLQT